MSTVWHDAEARSLLGDLPPGKDRALLHLLTCPSCREWATHRLLQEQGLRKQLQDYDDVFGRIHANLPWILEAAERRRTAVGLLITKILQVPPGERLKVALAEGTLQPVDLLEASQQEQPQDPERSIALAGVAAEVTSELFREEPDEGLVALYFARAASLEANAYRLQGNLETAEKAAQRASYYLAWPFDSWDRAVFCRVLGLLRWEQGRLDEAAALLRQAAREFSEQCLPEEEGASQVLVGLLSLERHETEMAIRLLQSGRATLDPEERPWLTVRAGLSLAQALAEIGHHNRAAGVLDETRWHYARASEEREQVSIYWLEGKVCARLGRREEAGNLLAAVRLQFIGERRLPETLLSSLDLAALLMEEGRAAELPALLREIEVAFGLDETAIEVTKAMRGFVAEIAGLRIVPPEALAVAASTLRRVFRVRGVRVESLPFA